MVGGIFSRSAYRTCGLPVLDCGQIRSRHVFSGDELFAKRTKRQRQSVFPGERVCVCQLRWWMHLVSAASLPPFFVLEEVGCRTFSWRSLRTLACQRMGRLGPLCFGAARMLSRRLDHPWH